MTTATVDHWAYREVPDDMPEVWHEQQPSILGHFGAAGVIGGAYARLGWPVKVGLLTSLYGMTCAGKDIAQELSRYLMMIEPNNQGAVN